MRVSGSEAQHLIRRCEHAVNAERKVLIGFKLGDLWTELFTYTKGKRAGEQGVSLKARLLFVRWIKVDGQLVYKAEARTGPETDDGTEPSVPETAQAEAEVVDDADADAEVPALAKAEAF